MALQFCNHHSRYFFHQCSFVYSTESILDSLSSTWGFIPAHCTISKLDPNSPSRRQDRFSVTLPKYRIPRSSWWSVVRMICHRSGYGPKSNVTEMTERHSRGVVATFLSLFATVRDQQPTPLGVRSSSFRSILQPACLSQLSVSKVQWTLFFGRVNKGKEVTFSSIVSKSFDSFPIKVPSCLVLE